ncbi:hypothetical protein [Acidisphaera sp. L21]|jgi:hypothetical protein|uniref:hypothetical protein n=1 Tax=Acidisphaera sp. L21 TaxID=1641851 RepID=UPI00131DCE95|nr:hypothetical protein [Acidisphaera sp. L21]
MFSPGQKVWHRNGQRSGRVLEVDGNRVYIAQDNGAELDFPASELTATPPVTTDTAGDKLRSRVAAKSMTYEPPNRTLTAADMTPDHARVLAAIPQRTLRAVAALFERKPGAGRFSALAVADKLNVVTEITAVPYRTMREYSDRPGELGLLMGKGLADKSS